MPTGGPRPGAGRKHVYRYFIKGVEYEDVSDAAKANSVIIQTIHNWCSSKKKSDCWKEPINAPTEKPRQQKNLDDIKEAANSENMEPLDYMLKIMNDESEDKETRIRCGYYALQYRHAKPTGKIGKKVEQQENAEKAGAERFSTGKPPLTVVKTK